MPSIAAKKIEDVLFEKRLITADQLSALKFEQANTGKTIEQILRERGYVTEEAFMQAYSEVCGVGYVDLRNTIIDQALTDILPQESAKKYGVVPFELKGTDLSVAMLDPLNLQVIEFIERKTGHRVIPFVATQKEMNRILEDYRGSSNIGQDISAALEEISQTTLKLDEGQGNLADMTLRDAPIARIVGTILEAAVKLGASDVHIEPVENQTRIRFRIDGVLEEKRTLPKEMHDSIVARIKILANMKIDEKRIPLDGRFNVQIGKTSTDLRISSLPTVHGEKIVIRLLKEESTVFTFKDLGMRGLALQRFEQAIKKPNGMILVTGPTSSGKTVTLASALSKLNTIRVNILTIEDPVEIKVAGVNQVQINPAAGLTFASGLRSFLRQDPNIIMVGEIRDGETAELAVQAALTGHLVLSTLHTNSASGALPRLLDMGIENFLLASTVNLVVAQRLTRKICDNCKEEYSPPDEVRENIRAVLANMSKAKVIATKDPEIAESLKKLQQDKFTLFRGKGCDKCGNAGYKGRYGIFEALEMSEAIAHLALERASSDQIEKVAISEGMITLLQDGFLRVVHGDTTIEEVMRVVK